LLCRSFSVTGLLSKISILTRGGSAHLFTAPARRELVSAEWSAASLGAFVYGGRATGGSGFSVFWQKCQRRRLARCRRYGAKINPCKFECGGDKLKELLDTAGVTSSVLGAKSRVIADPNVDLAPKPLASAVERDPQCLVTIEAETFILSVARTVDNMGLKVTNLMGRGSLI